MGYQHIQLDYLEKMAAEDADTRRELLLMVVADLETSARRLKVLWENQNRTELQWLCHHLKSTLPFVGNERLASANRLLEQHLRQEKQTSPIHLLVFEMGILIPEVLKELRLELEKR